MKPSHQLPFAAPIDFVIALKPEGKGKEEWYIFSGDLLLVKKENKALPNSSLLNLQQNLYIGKQNKKHLYAGEVEKGQEAPSGWIWSSLRDLYQFMSRDQFSIAGRALQLIDWDRKNKYCGRCGKQTQHRDYERCRECPSCNQLAYPILTPVAMALVQRGSQILLARGSHFPNKMYSILAGYADPGETLEQCVMREVFEEVGLKVNNIRYFGNQPWPFSRSLLIAFSCDWVEGEIQIDSAEIEDANWYDRNHLPELPPPLSIARMLIDSALSV